jgi:serine/threonine protein phosphatase PrpC
MVMENDGVRVDSASISDRGLSDKRPQNEDSFLEMNRCGIFAVADGVGGAQAGDVASQMAVEILGEAFANRPDGVDAEEVMRSAVQQANSAIYQMALELPQLSSMATTIVALHLSGNIATIGHVGDSRLYRVDRDGNLHRETEDHSMVAEEVRAGRMTEEQAENHPSRNIISRALGAEPTVDVDLKTIMIEPGTAFLICSDGITRHVGDQEIKGVLTFGGGPADICEYLKDLCYARGAEDNLTAVVVKVRTVLEEIHDTAPQSVPVEEEIAPGEDEDVTIATARSPWEEVLDESDDQDLLELDTDELQQPAVQEPAGEEPLNEPYVEEATPAEQVPAEESVVVPSQLGAFGESAPPPSYERPPVPNENKFDTAPSPFDQHVEVETDGETNGTFGKMASGVLMLLIGSLIGLAAYHFFLAPAPRPPANTQLSEMRSANIPLSAFEENRRNVDKDPAGYIARFAASPQDSEDYYLLGRAYLLTGDYAKARAALIESRNTLGEADPVNRNILASDIAIAMAVTNDTTIQTNLRKELEGTNSSVTSSANVNR